MIEAPFLSAVSVHSDAYAGPDLLKTTLRSGAPCPNPQMLIVLIRDLLVDRTRVTPRSPPWAGCATIWALSGTGG